MNPQLLSTSSLISLHEGIRECLISDDAGLDRPTSYYGVREHRDWRTHCDKLEIELARRDMVFEPINF